VRDYTGNNCRRRIRDIYTEREREMRENILAFYVRLSYIQNIT
jgi:hypothetical protein